MFLEGHIGISSPTVLCILSGSIGNGLVSLVREVKQVHAFSNLVNYLVISMK